LFQLGEINVAISRLRECIHLYKSIGDNHSEIIVSMNLALLYFSIGEFSYSLGKYNEIRHDVIKLGDKNSGAFFSQSSIIYALMGDIKKALDVNSLACDLFSDFPREQAIYYENLGWIHLIEGNYEAAEEALQKGLDISLNIAPESALVSQIKRRLGDANLGLGQYELAGKYSDEALAVAEKINERVEIAACYRIYAQLDGINRNDNRARKWFKKSIDLFAMIGSQYELAATRYLAATSGLYHNGERQALLYLAREYFESEDVVPYIEKVNAEIKRGQSLPVPRPISSDKEAPVIVAIDAEMRRLVKLAGHIAPSDMSVLLTGPTGSGKDLFARFIHHYSGRTGRFISVNAAAVPDDMIESELFGYHKGAYTGADKTTRGWIEESDRGTFYLNEVADASLKLQAKLLDVIENRRLCRLGEREERKLDFRVIAATNHDIEQLIQENKFRADLYHRLNEIRLELPSLNDRPDDFPHLIRHFLKVGGVDIGNKEGEAGFNRLLDILSKGCRQWEGNVRQLEAEIRRLVLLARGDLREIIKVASRTALTEREELEIILRQNGWNKSKAAKILGLTEGAGKVSYQ